ncbi:MAG: hypothetical protein LBG58_07105 [Planctomycetaceae bacterium]|jgi:hypothetical protein|nr:hypothetical protein [Planctomycetaceae bacterium]
MKLGTLKPKSGTPKMKIGLHPSLTTKRKRHCLFGFNLFNTKDTKDTK